ncbi:MAG: O-methyltransferase [Spirulina sp.]
MASGPLILQFLQFLIQATGTKKILEIGTFIGLSAMYFAEALPADGLVVTIEKFADFADIARINFQKNQFEDKIKLIVGDAFKVLKEQDLGNSFDFIFIDGNKEHYGDYLDFAIALLSENGTIVIDNVTFQGDILNSPPKTPKGLGVMNCLEKIKNLSGWDISLIPFNDGLLLLRRSPTSH